MARLVDVAARAGVSPSTVSNVFNNPDRVRPTTREQVLAAAEDLGFRPNLVARSLRSGDSPLTAILVSDARIPFVAEVVRSSQERLIEAGRLPIVVSTDGDDLRLEAAIAELRARGVDSFLSTPIPYTYSPSALELFQALADEGVVLAFISNQLADTALQTVTTDVFDGCQRVVDHLVDLGPRTDRLPRHHRRTRCDRLAAIPRLRRGDEEPVPARPRRIHLPRPTRHRDGRAGIRPLLGPADAADGDRRDRRRPGRRPPPCLPPTRHRGPQGPVGDGNERRTRRATRVPAADDDCPWPVSKPVGPLRSWCSRGWIRTGRSRRLIGTFSTSSSFGRALARRARPPDAAAQPVGRSPVRVKR